MFDAIQLDKDVFERMVDLGVALQYHKRLETMNETHHHTMGEALAAAKHSLSPKQVELFKSIKRTGDRARHVAFRTDDPEQPHNGKNSSTEREAGRHANVPTCRDKLYEVQRMIADTMIADTEELCTQLRSKMHRAELDLAAHLQLSAETNTPEADEEIATTEPNTRESHTAEHDMGNDVRTPEYEAFFCRRCHALHIDELTHTSSVDLCTSCAYLTEEQCANLQKDLRAGQQHALLLKKRLRRKRDPIVETELEETIAAIAFLERRLARAAVSAEMVAAPPSALHKHDSENDG